MHPWKRRPALIVAAATAAGCAWVWCPATALGIRGEWEWPRIPFSGVHYSSWLTSAAAALGYMAVVSLAAWRLSRAARAGAAGLSIGLTRAGWVAVVLVAAIGWWFTLLKSLPEPFGLERCPLVLYYGRMSGYFWEARYTDAPTRQLLAGYETMLAGRDDPQRYLHIGTHPPGMILLYRGLLSWIDSAPWMIAPLERTIPSRVHDAFTQIATAAQMSGLEFSRRDAACLWVATWLTLALSAATVAALAGLLARSGLPFHEGLRWASLWAFVPAVCVFLPKCDLLLPFPALLAAWLWLTALDRRSLLRGFAAGMIVFGGLFLSLAFVPVVLWIGLTTLLEFWKSRPGNDPRRPAHDTGPSPRGAAAAVRVACAAAVGFLGPLLALWLGAHLNLLHAWQLNFANHAEFYSHSPRSYVWWLVANPLELALAIGPPLAALACIGGLQDSIRFFRRGEAGSASTVASAIVLTLLWLSGKNMGEVARLWIVFLPWLLAAAARARQGARGVSATLLDRPPLAGWAFIALCQAVIAIAISSRLDGFGLEILLAPAGN